MLHDIFATTNALTVFHWVPAHVVVVGNEDADQLAKEALALPVQSRGDRMATPPPPNYYRGLLRRVHTTRWCAQWRGSATAASMHGMYPNVHVLSFL